MNSRKVLLFALPVVVIGLIAAWVLISPLFIRPTVVETNPLVGTTAPAKTGDAKPAPAPTTGADAKTAATTASGAQILGRGTFDQKDAVHKGSGEAVLATTADGKRIVRFENFSVTNGPDLFVFLSGHPSPRNTQELHQNDVNLGKLKAPQGAFSYEIDPSVDLSRVKSVVVYCRAFSVVFSSAELRSP